MSDPRSLHEPYWTPERMREANLRAYQNPDDTWEGYLHTLSNDELVAIDRLLFAARGGKLADDSITRMLRARGWL